MTMKQWKALALLTCVLLFSGFDCGTDVKSLGRSGTTPQPNSSSAGSNNFTISFGVRTTSTEDDLDVQGGTLSSAALQGGCGSAGTNCICDFFTDSSGSGMVSSATGSTTYNVSGNFLHCQIPTGSTPATFTHMRIRDRSNLRFSNTVEITNQDDADLTKRLTLLKILGDLPANEVRKIYEYRCYLNYLRKTGTTTTTFDCTNSGGFSLVQVPYHFYLFSDNKTSNFASRVPDLLHNDGSGTLCGALIKFIDCTTSFDGATNPNDVTLKFGLYARSVGQFTVPVQLTNAPARLSGFSTVVGFAAKFDTATSTCPPGFEVRQNFSATPAAVSDSNLNATLADIQVSEPTSIPNLLVDTFTGGLCNGTTCSAPAHNRDSVTPANLDTDPYVAQTGATDKFCVLPSSLLSGI